ncbi:glycoside hydrolase family 2 protein [Cohnella silvisoli]|uniref:beta-mannosidase n=1 Tax=Cohnella silvisoli TaxID=2873699 RepID=A0ABV1L2E0_9BACL|nr:glycoside hydrolase family 2 protein [Cohnella silvisoli]MCD9025791.1 beta-mannosidase [Cohnella silvisoli]
MYKMTLNDGWAVCFEDLSWGADRHGEVTGRTDGWMEASLPCDIHMPLIETGVIEEPLVKDHFFDCEWTEHKSWWFRKTFRPSVETCSMNRVELVLESLDAEADIFLNGIMLGHHRSAFYPFRQEVKSLLREGDNELLVRVTSGLEAYDGEDMTRFKDRVGMEKAHNRGDIRRIFARKPQYGFGWDWGPRVATCGIVGDVYLAAYDDLAIRQVHAFTESVSLGKGGDNSGGANEANIRFEVEVEQFHPFASIEAHVEIRLSFAGESILTLSKSMPLHSGLNFVDFRYTLTGAKLWWPNDMGSPDLYTVFVSVSTGGHTASYPSFEMGIRTIELNQNPVNENERLFAIHVNGVRTFCKGGNWVPADSVYARITEEKYKSLVEEAKEAHFNMLRVWGGGLYEKNAFYEACDRNGIMVWQDFMFACALYPDDLEWFQEEVRQEMEYQTSRLRNHASLVLWCGNNENHWNFDMWKAANPDESFVGGAVCYNELAPRIVRRNCPEIPYWNSSPYGGEHPNGEDRGDCHYWFDAMMSPEMANRITPERYDGWNAKFVSEYGYIGPCRKSTIERFHAGEPFNREGRIWQLHNNLFEKDTVAAGIEMHYADAGGLDVDRYLLYAGLCQGLMYGYSLEAFRYRTDCSGGLFWMYNDCWGEIGWSVIDYELRRKISWYFVKRACAPVTLIAREVDGNIRVIGINETGKDIRCELEYGYVSFDGRIRSTSKTSVGLPAYSRGVALEFAKEETNRKEGCWFVTPGTNTAATEVLPAVLREGAVRDLNLASPTLTVRGFIRLKEDIQFTVGSDVYAHAVHFGLSDHLRLSDEYFDLLPGQSRTVTIYGASDIIGLEQIQPRAVQP